MERVGIALEYSNVLLGGEARNSRAKLTVSTAPCWSISTVLDLSSFMNQRSQEVVTFVVIQSCKLVAFEATRLFAGDSRGTIALAGGMQ